MPLPVSLRELVHGSSGEATTDPDKEPTKGGNNKRKRPRPENAYSNDASARNTGTIHTEKYDSESNCDADENENDETPAQHFARKHVKYDATNRIGSAECNDGRDLLLTQSSPSPPMSLALTSPLFQSTNPPSQHERVISNFHRLYNSTAIIVGNVSNTNNTGTNKSNPDIHGNFLDNERSQLSAVEELYVEPEASDSQQALGHSQSTTTDNNQNKDPTNRARIVEWDKIRNRWKRRKYDLRSETDTGLAMQAFVAAQQRQQNVDQRIDYNKSNNKNVIVRRKQPPARTCKNQLSVAKPEVFDLNSSRNTAIQKEEEEDEDQQQQDAILSQLLQPSQDHGDRQRAALAAELEAMVVPSYAETLSSWEYARYSFAPVGKGNMTVSAWDSAESNRLMNMSLKSTMIQRGDAHRRTSQSQTALNFHPDPVTSTSVNSGRPSEVDSHEDEVFVLRTFGELKQRPPPSRKRPRGHLLQTDFPLLNDVSSSRNASASLTHRRFVFRGSARHLVGTAGCRVAAVVDDRCIQVLWKLSHRKAFDLPIQNNKPSKNGSLTEPMSLEDITDDKVARVAEWSLSALLVNQLCRRNGQAMQTFYEHTWRDRQAAADFFGVSPTTQLFGPDVSMRNSFLFGAETRISLELQKYVNENSLKRISNGTSTFSPSTSRDPFEKTRIKVKGGCSLVASTSAYSFVPGTIPPDPPKPLDSTGIIFGATDRYEHVLQQGEIDESVYTLTVSSLVSQLALALTDLAREKIRMQLQAMLRQIVKLNQHKMYKRLQRQFKMIDLEVPLAFFYKSLVTYCAACVNGILWQTSSSREHVEHLLDVLEENIDHNGLQMFTELHLLFALLRIALLLPESGVHIVSLAFDHNSCRTPFDKIRQLLQHLEDCGSLRDNDRSSSDSDRSVINVGELEFAFHRASRITATGVQRDSIDVNLHCWHLCMLAASLLICSGNYIGSGSSAIPSDFAGQSQNHSLSMLTNIKTLPGGRPKRRMLPKFYELRKETAQSFHLLLQLAKYQKGTRAHLAMASFLEWRQVVALMIGPEATSETYQGVCSLHRHHEIEWILQESTPDLLKSMYSSGNASLDERLLGIANKIELNPSNIESWRELVRALGPIGRVGLGNLNEQCKMARCGECSRVTEGSNIDHASLRNRQRRGQWWGRNKCDWWYETLLQRDHKQALASPTYLDFEVVQEMHTALVALFRDSAPALCSKANTMRADKALDRTLSEVWIDDLLQRPVQLPGKNKVPAVKKYFDSCLPRSFRREKQQYRPSSDWAMIEPLNLSGNDARKMEIRAYKSLILCHLYSTMHPGVDLAVDQLIDGGWDKDTRRFVSNSDGARCLHWLHKSGLNVVHIFRQSQQIKTPVPL